MKDYLKGMLLIRNPVVVALLTVFSGICLALPQNSDPDSNWSKMLEEGNSKAFIHELQRVAACINAAKESEETFDESELNPCRRTAKFLIEHRGQYGRDLLHTYMRVTKQEVSDLNSVFKADMTDDLEVIKILSGFGLKLSDSNGELEKRDHLLVVLAEYGRLKLLNLMLESLKEHDPEKYRLVSNIKSTKGMTLANLLLSNYPDLIFVSSLIIRHQLIRTLSEVNAVDGMAYQTLKFGRKDEL